MPQSFEDYQRWLGWEDASRPPNYYELFGVERSVSDPHVLGQAAETAMSRVRSQRPGDHARSWAAMLDELKEAKATLLDPARRAAYDETLPAEVMADPAPAAPASPASSAAAPVNPMYPPGMGGNTLDAPETPAPGEGSQPAQASSAPVNPAPAAEPSQPAAEEEPGILPAAFNNPVAPAPTGWGVPTQQPQQPQQPNTPVTGYPGQAAVQPQQPTAGQPVPMEPMQGQPMANGGAVPQTPQAGVPAAQPVSQNGPTTQAPMAVAYPAGTAPAGQAPAATPYSPAATPPPTAAPGASPVAPLGTGGVRNMASLADSSPAISSPSGPMPTGLDSITDDPSVQSQAGQGKSSSLNLVIIGCSIACLLLVGAIAGVLLKGKDDPADVAQGEDGNSEAQVTEDDPGENEPMPPDPPEPGPMPEPTPPEPEPQPQPMPEPEPDPQPTPDPPEPGPMPEPEPEPAPEPEPEPEPNLPPPTREELLELRGRFEAILTSLSERNVNLARAHLAAAQPLAREPEHQAMFKRHEQLTELVDQFWNSVAAGYDSLSTGEDLVIGASTKVTVVQKSGDSLEITLVGQTRRYNGPEELPTGLAAALAGLALADDPAARYESIGAWYAVDPSAETGEALKFWQQAAASGADVSELTKILDEDYNLTGDPEPTAESAAQLGQLLAAARAALTSRDIEAAQQTLEQAAQLPMIEEHRAKFNRLNLLAQYVNEFWLSYAEARSNLSGGVEISAGNSVVSVVEVRPDLLIIRVSGRNQRYTDQDIPAGLARAIADQWLDQEAASTRVIKGAIAAVDPDGGPERAREYWTEAQFFGADLEDLMLVLEDTYDDLPADLANMQ